MSNFGIQSKKYLSTAHPDLQKLFNDLRLPNCTIISGGRSLAQEKDYFYGTNLTGINPAKEILSKTLNSKHIFVNEITYALDVAPDPVNFDRKNYVLDQCYFAGVVMTIAKELNINIRWGGDWDRDNQVSDETFEDLDHFELRS